MSWAGSVHTEISAQGQQPGKEGTAQDREGNISLAKKQGEKLHLEWGCTAKSTCDSGGEEKPILDSGKMILALSGY